MSIRLAQNWQDYTLLDATDGFRLERWGDVILQRPDPQVIWRFPKTLPQWEKPDAVYRRSAQGGGEWETRKPLPEHWQIRYKTLTLKVSPTGFKHTGVFPEQAANWDHYEALIRLAAPRAKHPLKVLNLFGYTGGATLACAAAGAAVTHVDASKGMVTWARENAALSGLADKPIRWIVDDCLKFVSRELRRGSRYDAILMDPPSYGRGPGGEVWKLEEAVYELLCLTAQLLSDTPLFFAVNSYTTGLAPSVMGYMVQRLIGPLYGGSTENYELGLPVQHGGGALPCGATSFWVVGGEDDIVEQYRRNIES